MRNPELYIARERVWESLKEINKAIGDYSNALAVDPANGKALRQLKQLGVQRALWAHADLETTSIYAHARQGERSGRHLKIK